MQKNHLLIHCLDNLVVSTLAAVNHTDVNTPGVNISSGLLLSFLWARYL